MGIIEIDFSNANFSSTKLNLILTLSTITNKKVNLLNIKLNKEQVRYITAIKTMTSSYVEGGVENSEKIHYSPSKLFAKKRFHLNLDDNYAYPILNTIMLLSLFSKDKLQFKINSLIDNIKYPSYDFVKESILKYVEKYYEKIILKLSNQKELVENMQPSITSKVKEVFLSIKSLDKKIQKPFNLRYDYDLFAIKLNIYLGKECNDNYSKQIVDLFKLYFSDKKIPIMANTIYDESYSDEILINSFLIYGEEKDNELTFKYAKYLPAQFSGCFFSDASHFQTEILNHIKNLNQKILNKGISYDEAIFLLPLIAFFGGEVLVEEINKDIKQIINYLELFLEIKFEIKGNFIFCKKPFLN